MSWSRVVRVDKNLEVAAQMDDLVRIGILRVVVMSGTLRPANYPWINDIDRVEQKSL